MALRLAGPDGIVKTPVVSRTCAPASEVKAAVAAGSARATGRAWPAAGAVPVPEPLPWQGLN